PPVIPDNGHSHADCRDVCEQLSSIISTVNKLADIINKAIDACCSTDTHHHKETAAKCSCSDKV
ncbi:VWA domain-containing protein, partial [Morganella morganii subsp. sibonii]